MDSMVLLNVSLFAINEFNRVISFLPRFNKSVFIILIIAAVFAKLIQQTNASN